MWGDAAKASYDPENTPHYARNILGPMRKYYTSDKRADKELLSGNIQVEDSSPIFCAPFSEVISETGWRLQCI